MVLYQLPDGRMSHMKVRDYRFPLREGDTTLGYKPPIPTPSRIPANSVGSCDVKPLEFRVV